MKKVSVISSTFPAKPRSEKYTVGATVVRSTGTGASSGGGTGGNTDIDIVKENDAKSFTDTNVLSALRALAEFISKKNDSEVKAVVDYLNGIKINGKPVTQIILKATKVEEIKDTDVMSALRVVSEIVSNNEELKKVFLSKVEADTAAEIITFSKGLVSKDKITTLSLLVQELAGTYDLDVTHVATTFRTIVKDYISSEQFVSGLAGSGMKLYKALNGDWNLEVDNATIRKAMTIFELIISKIRAVNGGLVVSSANGRIKSVVEEEGFYKIGIEGDMMFIADDYVRCQVFNSNQYKYYWVPVSRIEGDYIYIAKSEFPESTIPSEGDDLIQFGNKTNTARQGILYLTASEDGKPRFSVLDGVNSTDLTGKSKVILGCLDGITDTDFPADFQPSGYGLYAMNVFLKGLFILRNGKTVEDELSGQITAVETKFEIREGQISSKVTEATNAATTAGQKASDASGSASSASSSATDAGTYAGNAANSANSAAGSAGSAASSVQTVSVMQSEINQKADNITLQVGQVTSLTVEAANAAQLATAMSKGKMLYRDPTFASGSNSVYAYNNNGNGMVNIYREAVEGCPNTSGYGLRIVSQGNASPASGGFYFATPTRANAVFVTRFVAKIPVGSYLGFASNATGDGGSSITKWLTDSAGTGDWKEYAYYVKCGTHGEFSSTNFFYITHGDAVTWYIAYATVFDTTGVDDTPTVDEIRSSISISPNQIGILGLAISLTGAVTFNSMAGDAQGKINSAQDTANSAQDKAGGAQNTADSAWGKADNAQGSADTANRDLGSLSGSLRSLAFLDTIGVSKLDSTIIDGGKIVTNLINSHLIITEGLAAGMIYTSNLAVTEGAQIGNFVIQGGGLYADNSTSLIGMSNNGRESYMSAGQIGIIGTGTGSALNVNSSQGYASFLLNEFMVNANRISFDANVTINGKGSSEYDHALTINSGNIYGFRLRVRRVNSSQTLSGMDSVVIVKSDVTLTLPTDAEDGQIIYMRRVGSFSYTVRVASGQTLYRKDTVTTSDRPGDGGWRIFIYDAPFTSWYMGWTN